MAEEKTEQNEQPEKAKSNVILIVVIVFLFIILLGFGGGGYYLYQDLKSDQSGETNKKIEKVEKKEINDDEVIEKDTEEFIVNIIGSSRTYLKIKMTLVFAEDDFDEELYTKKTPYVTDSILGLLSSKTRDEISTLGGKTDLKDELKTKLNLLLPKELEVRKILFTTFVMQ